MNKSQELLNVGQSIWYDNIQRSLLKNGEMARMIADGEIYGVTSNPAIFMNAIARSPDYDESLVPLAKAGCTAEEIYAALAIEDIQAAADLLMPVYQQSAGANGYVSLEVSPYLAHDPAGTIAEAKRLWQVVNRPNLMIKIPATRAGIPAVEEAIATGLNVNVTLIFSLERYVNVIDAYLRGLEKCAAAGLPLQSVASVASFFVSRVDTNIDPRLQRLIDLDDPQAPIVQTLLGRAAIANARLAYARYKEIFNSERFQMLKEKGAQVQRPLWASTSTKNPNFRDVIYVEELIGPDTVNTAPPQTLAAFLDHGQIRLSLEENLLEARQHLEALEKLGISIRQVTDQLEVEGVQAFSDAFTVLLKTVEERRLAVVS
jgi:transaldolase